MRDINEILEGFRQITLEEMDSVKLMNRVDTKFVLTEGQLAEFLEMCAVDYKVLTIEGKKVAGYESLYYDTADRVMYLRHLYGRKTRQKVRTRTYLDSGLTFLEIKRKDNHRRTRKKRMEIQREEFGDFAVNEKAVEYVAKKSWYRAEELQPALDVSFRRITLVNEEMTERMTIDRELKFNRDGACSSSTGRSVALEGIVIVEIKQDGLVKSVARERMHRLGIQEFRVSKYCIGTVLTCPELPNNRMKPKIRYINKLQKIWKNTQILTHR